MKKVIGMLALVALVGNIANAELLKNFKANGSVEVNAYNVTNQDFNKKADDKVNKTDTRVQLNATFDVNEDVSAVVSAVKCNRQYGQASESVTGAAGVLDNVFFEQAYLNLKGVVGMDHKLGRQYYGEQGDMVIYYGPQGWPYTHPMNRNAIDGWTGYYSNWGVNFTGLVANEDQNIATPEEDITVNGLTAAGKLYDVALNGYVYQKNDKSNSLSGSSKTDYLNVVGLKAKYAVPQVKNLNVAGEYAMNMGINNDLKNHATPASQLNYEHQGYAYKVNADYSMDLMGKLSFMGEYYYATGDRKADKKDKAFKDINADYRPGVIVGGGFTGTITNPGTGSVVMNLGANWTPEQFTKLNIAANYYDFSYAEKHATAAGAKTNMGTESDLVLTWTHSDNVNVKGYYAMFSPEKKNLAVNAKDDSESVMGAAFNVKF